MRIDTIIPVIAAVMGFALPEGIISIDAPVAINDSLAFTCLDQSQNAEELMEALGLPEKWNSDNFATILPVHISVPERPSLILMLINNSDETMGYLLSCSEQGDIIDSRLVYSWISEGAYSLYTYIDEDGSIFSNSLWIESWGDSHADTAFLQTDGTFTMNRSSVMMECKETQ